MPPDIVLERENGFPLGVSPDALLEIADYADIGILNWHIPSNHISLNEPIVKLTGYEMYEVPHTGATRRSLVFEEDQEMVEANIRACVEGAQDRYRIVYRMNRRDGSIVSVLESAMVYERGSDGRAVRLVAMVVDLSALKHLEARVAALEQENRALREGMTGDELAAQVHVLRAVNAATAGIVGGFYQDYESILLQALKTIGESLGADALCIYKVVRKSGRKDGHAGGAADAPGGGQAGGVGGGEVGGVGSPTDFGAEGEPVFYLRSAWEAGQSMPIVPDPSCVRPLDALPREIAESFRQGRVFRRYGDGVPGFVRALLGAGKARGVILAPLILHGAFWGIFQGEDWKDDRLFSDSEAEIAAAGATVIASSIARNETLKKLNEAREEAMASTRAKGEFLSRMSHEIRTPMNAIIGMSAIARKADDFDQVKRALDKIDASSRQLMAIINDVLDMSKIDSGRFEIVSEPFDFDRMVQNALNVIQVRLEEKRQELKIEIGEVISRMVVGDELRLSQVLINLLGNAVKFTPNGGTITLRVSCLRERTAAMESVAAGDALRLRVEVADNGVGISDEGQSRLFTAFEQADGGISRQFGGTGLGLAISKRIVSLMGGDIWVSSKLGEGSTFVFEVEARWGEPLPYGKRGGGALPHMRILVADDAADVREYFGSVLDSFSQDYDTAEDGEQAVEMARRAYEEGRPYSLYFIDWNMPGMNGGETARALREAMGGNAVVVTISVADWGDIESEARKHGITQFLAKPVMPSALYNCIQSLTQGEMAKAAAATATDAKAPDLAGKTILLAEDIEINREIIMSVLEETRVCIDVAENGLEAVEKFAAAPERYDAILMDVQMPSMDGISATKEIRSMNFPRAKSCPILAMTANAFKEDQEACINAGMNGHLAKPLDVDALYRTLSRFISP